MSINHATLSKPNPSQGLISPADTNTMHTTAVLLIAHGSRRPAANDDLAQLAEVVKSRRPDALVEIAYLELAAPDIALGGQRCVERGAREVRMFPYFLSAGEHVVRDLEHHRRELAARFPQVEFVLCPPLGLHPLIVEVVLERVGQSMTPRASGASAKIPG